MREIKFRAWAVQAEKMVCVNQIDFMAKGLFLNESGGGCGWLGVQYKDIMQFTGLHDKNGKEIWEGDVLQGSETSPKYTVVFERSSWMVTYKFNGNGGCISINDKYDLFEVIGNIYENQELLSTLGGE